MRKCSTHGTLKFSTIYKSICSVQNDMLTTANFPNPTTFATRLQEWERFFLTGEESHTSSACDAAAFESDYCPDFLIAEARCTSDAYLRALAARCDRLCARWHGREERSESCGAGTVTMDDLDHALNDTGAPTGPSNVFDLWSGRPVAVAG